MGTFNAEEAFDLFWDEYDKALTGGLSSGKGVRKKALTSFKRKVTSAKKAGLVLSKFRMQRDEWLRNKKGDEWQANFPHVSTYLNQERWETEVDAPQTQQARRSELQECSEPNCRDKVAGPAFDECERHLNRPAREKEKAELIDWMKENKLMKRKSETNDQWRQRMRESARQGFREMLNKSIVK